MRWRFPEQYLLLHCEATKLPEPSIYRYVSHAGVFRCSVAQVLLRVITSYSIHYTKLYDRHKLGVLPVYKRVDTCAAEFATDTAYMYSTYEEECEANPSGRDKIMVIGGGPNRIGQGIEFDYCCA